MTGNRSARIRLRVAEQAALRGARVGLVDVCTAAVAALPVGGAGVSAMSPCTAGHPLCSTDDVSERLEELQLTVGEGPCVDAFAHGSAVLTPDLRSSQLSYHWPVFADAALEAGIRAVFAFPLQIGAISPGVLDLYSSMPVELDVEQLADALAFADFTTLVLLDTQIDRPGDRRDTLSPDGRQEDLGSYPAEIDQATGILTVQLGVGIDVAFVRLRAHAYATGVRLADVAADVVAHRLRLSLDSDSGADADSGDDSDFDSGSGSHSGSGSDSGEEPRDDED
ncbi:GAF and ANTAR domain-containing protein [Streptomyces sp. NPDC023838]|uniref:GAF and ANTAR domain-containing protein n=1 Tax=Streptomyces sp. NPDC023838 TaxID=3154325 RepID=UPI0033D89605